MKKVLAITRKGLKEKSIGQLVTDVAGKIFGAIRNEHS